jgi:hypothetical protein
MSKNVTLRGIVVTGDSREQAIANFVAAAKGDDVSAHIDSENGFVVLSNAQTDETVFLNPLTGMASLKPASDSIVKQLTFRSESSADADIPAFYTVCSSCFSHTVAEDRELAKHCVVCASELKDLSESEIAALQPETTQPTVGLMAVATDAKDAIAKFRDLYEGKSDHKVYDCGNGNMVVASASDVLKFSPQQGNKIAEAENVPFTASASSENGITAHIFSCVSSSCGVHVVSSDDSPVFCPVCASGVIEPDEEDLEDYEDAECEDDEDCEGDDSVATASDDEDEDEDLDEYLKDDDSEESDEDEEDDSEDEDEDEGDSDDSEDEDEDFDSESSTLVVASATAAVSVAAPAKPEPVTAPVTAPVAVASAEPQIVEVIKEVVVEKEVPVHQTVIATNLLDMVATAGDLDANALTLVIANNVDRDTKWIAFHKDTPIATASARTTKHQDIFATPAFGNVVVAAARNDGVREALNEYGFSGIATSVPVDTYVQQSVEEQVNAQVSEASAQYASEHNDYADRFQCALSTAARAIDIGYYQDSSHPVKDRLLATFSQLGVHNAGELVNAAFASSSDEYVDVLIKKARDVMSLSAQVQNEFTAVIASGSKTSGALAFGKPVAEPVKPMTSVSNSTNEQAPDLIKQAVSSLRFSNRR